MLINFKYLTISGYAKGFTIDKAECRADSEWQRNVTYVTLLGHHHVPEKRHRRGDGTSAIGGEEEMRKRSIACLGREVEKKNEKRMSNTKEGIEMRKKGMKVERRKRMNNTLT